MYTIQYEKALNGQDLWLEVQKKRLHNSPEDVEGDDYRLKLEGGTKKRARAWI